MTNVKPRAIHGAGHTATPKPPDPIPEPIPQPMPEPMPDPEPFPVPELLSVGLGRCTMRQ